VNKYREGKVKRTPGGEWNRNWNRKLTTSRRTIRKSDCVLFVSRTGELLIVAEG